MRNELDFVLRSGLIGVGATIVMDLWALFLRTLNVKSLNYALVGRWVSYFFKGRFVHHTILQSPPMPGEAALGWCLHYGIGITFAALLLAVRGKGWASQPTLWPALALALVTTAVPFFVMQPAFGFGVAAAKTPNPAMARTFSLLAHAAYGVGLYLAALVLSRVF